MDCFVIQNIRNDMYIGRNGREVSLLECLKFDSEEEATEILEEHSLKEKLQIRRVEVLDRGAVN